MLTHARNRFRAALLPIFACLTVAVLFVRRREILSAVAGWLKVQPGPKLAIQLTLIPIVAGVAASRNAESNDTAPPNNAV